MRLFKHECHYCGLKHKDMVFIVGDSHYQCVDREACKSRHAALSFENRLRLDMKRRRARAW